MLGSKADAEGGNRTHTPRREPDFESGASANSATSAGVSIVAAWRDLAFAQLEAADGRYVLEMGRVALADKPEALKTNEQARKTYLGEE